MPRQAIARIGIIGTDASERTPAYRSSMYHDFAGRRPAELQAIYAAPLAAAQAAGVSTPKVQAFHQSLGFIQTRQEAGHG